MNQIYCQLHLKQLTYFIIFSIGELVGTIYFTFNGLSCLKQKKKFKPIINKWKNTQNKFLLCFFADYLI